MKTIKMNNGQFIPMIGIGTNTFGKEDNQYQAQINNETKELISAFKLGYKLIDTAIVYRNEGVVGLALTQSQMPRENFYLTTKIRPSSDEHSEVFVRRSVIESLQALKTDYIDLYLIHHPWDDLNQIVQVWRVLESFVDSKHIRSIGVSNFNEEQLSYLLKQARIKPVVNQIESHPGFWQDDLIAYCQSVGVIPQAWGPLSRVKPEMKDVLTKIGEKYHKTWAQVVLNYQVSRGVAVIPKSHRQAGQQENLNIFDFALTTQEKETIKSL